MTTALTGGTFPSPSTSLESSRPPVVPFHEFENSPQNPKHRSSSRSPKAQAHSNTKRNDGPGVGLNGELFVLVQLDTKTLNVKESELLQTFWGNGLDTVCMRCQQPFNNPRKPAIRTISLEVPQAPASEDQYIAQLAEAFLHLPMSDSPMIKRYDHSEAYITWLVEGTEDGRIWGSFGHQDSLAMNVSSSSSSTSLPRKPLFHDNNAANGATKDVDISKLPAFSMRVWNRHLECMQTNEPKIQFIPISHVWHSVVGAAQRNREPDPEASRLVYTQPFRTLLALANRYGHDVEIWHDYISIPQWQNGIQQSLLMALPEVFNYPAFSCVHLDDVSHDCIKRLMGESSYGERLLSTAKLFRSEWFKRMWVCLEYAQSKEVRLVTQDYHIVHFPDFPLLLRSVVQQFIAAAFASKGPHFGRFINVCKGLHISRASTLDCMRLAGNTARTFGTVINVIAQRECRDYYDRFTAMRGFLRLSSDDGERQAQFQDATHACLDVALRCLERGDYTPLLLTPSGETTVSGYSWLTGHERMSDVTWLLGRMTHAAIYSPIVSARRLTLILQPIGIIEDVQKVSFAGNELSTLEGIVTYIIAASGTCPFSFMTAVARIYFLPAWAARPGHYNPHMKISQSISLCIKSDPDLFHDLRSLLEDFKEQDDPWQRWHVLQDLIKLLHLSDMFASAVGGFSRLSFAKHTLSYFGAKDAESLAIVKCGGCNSRAVFRLAMWRKVDSPVQLYRIPGLGFQQSLEDGVGLAISEHRICGRVIYGTPACDCRDRELIRII